MKINISNRGRTIIFHLFLWSSWLFLSLSNTDDEIFEKTIELLALILLTHVPLFLLNTELLIPRLLLPKGASYYFGVLLTAVVLFCFWHQFVHESIEAFFGEEEHHGRRYFKGMVAILFVSAISTGYGLLNYVLNQEKIQQETQGERLKSELSFLRSQVSPHFIFNILNSIVYLIRTKSELAEQVTLKLSDLLRYMLYDSGNVLIPLEKELDYLYNYIDLQKIRFEEDVQILLHTDGQPDNLVIEPMILIPFVENAFKHGVGMVLDPVIDIAIKIETTRFSFFVKNKIAPESAENKDINSGIGLQNVRRRLALLYPNCHSLDIQNEQGWFSVQLNLTLANQTA